MKLGLVARRPLVDALAPELARQVELAWTSVTLEDAIALSRRTPVDALVLDASAVGAQAAARLGEVGAPCLLLRAADGSDRSAVYAMMSAGAAYAMDAPEDAEAGARAIVRAATRVASAAGTKVEGVPGHGSRLVALGASTGGPAALAAVLRGLARGGRSAGVRVVIVQHLEPEFVAGLGTWLSQETGIGVDLSTSTLSLAPGRALLAAGDRHLVMTPSGAFAHRDPAQNDLHHPSVDVLFSSLACGPEQGVAALLTGMGKDGAAGLLSLRRAGWTTVAEDASTAVVFGMPKAAIELGAAAEVLPLGAIGERLRRAAEAP